MKAMKMKYLLLFFSILGFAGCHDVTVGYLKTSYAKYGIDSLHVGMESVNAEIVKMEEKYWPLEGLSDAVKIVSEVGPYENDLNTEIGKLYAELSKLEEEGEEGNEERIEEIYTILGEKELLLEDFYTAQSSIDDAKWYIESEMEFTYAEAEIIYNQYLSYVSMIEKELPWTTARIEGVLGTEPIQYSIAGVTSEDGDAEIFRHELTIYGGGRMELPFNCKAPKGKYRVSILVENEGYSDVLENAFTFIID